MDDDFFNVRYAHADGHTEVGFDESGSYIVTCGADGDVRIWNAFDDDDIQSQKLGNAITAVALKNKLLYIATDEFAVSAYKFPELEFESIVAQYNSEVYDIACNEDGSLVASGGGDFIIKMFETSSKTLVAFRGHEGSVLGLTFDPNGKYLASTSCDGSLCIWQLSTQECIKKMNILKKSNDKNSSSSQGRLNWSPDGKFIAVPINCEVHLYKRDSWECAITLEDSIITQNTSIVAFSPYGNYVAAATIEGQLVVWDVKTKKCVSKKSHENKIAISGIAWNPSGKDIAFCDVQGQLGIHESPLTSSQDQEPNIDMKDVPIDFECEDDGDKNIDDDEANDLDLLHDKDDEDDDNAFDIGAIKATLEPKIFGDEDDAVESESVKSEKPEPTFQVIEAPKPLVQTAFQPSSTPVHLERRFMLWNSVGIVRCYNTDEENSIDVEFHDTNVYHPLHLNNTRNHTVAALSTEALLMACPKSEDGNSKLECLHFGTWDSNKEWIVEMPNDEEIESVCVGEGIAACITDKRLIRIFTVSGLQCEVISVPGPVVCSAAKDKSIVVAYHRGLGIENDQSLNIMMIDVRIGGHCRIKDYPAPLSPKSFLSWLGYTDEGRVCVVDSSGIVNILDTAFGMKWIPVANTKCNLKGKSDNYFVLGLSEIKEEIRCILCKGAKYPSLLPRPTVIVLPFSLPFCEVAIDKGRLEEENRRCSMTHKRIEGLMKEGFDLDSEFNTVEKKWMDVLLKLFALATRTDKEYRALDIAELMPTPNIIQGAIRYATQRHRMALAERLGEVMNKKLLAEAEEEMEVYPTSNYNEFDISENFRHSSSMRLVSSEDNETVLKPKPLTRTKYDSSITPGNSQQLLSDDKDSENCENISSPKTTPVSNPFKASSKLKSAKKDNCSSDIDTLLDTSMKNLHNKSNTSTPINKVPGKKLKSQDQKHELQTKLNNFQPESTPKKYGFQLFLEQNRDSIACSSESEMTETDIVKTAMKMFKELSESEKQKYTEKKDKENVSTGLNGINSAKEDDVPACSTETVNGDTSISSNGNSSKRKDNTDSEDTTPKPKKMKNIADNNVRKLTQFAFTKNKANK